MSMERRVAWTILGVAGLLEIVWATAMKQSNGFTRVWPSVIGVAAAATSFVLLALAVEHLPIGAAYAVWVGIGAVGVAIVGIVRFGDAATPLRLACIALVVVGVAGLRGLDG